jgi:hypothetical protein
MVKSVARLVLFRLLPGRVFLLLSIWDAWVLLREVRRRIADAGTVRVNEPSASRTAPPDVPRPR